MHAERDIAMAKLPHLSVYPMLVLCLNEWKYGHILDDLVGAFAVTKMPKVTHSAGR